MGMNTRNIARTIHMSHSSHVGLLNFLIRFTSQRSRWVPRASFRLEPLELPESPEEYDSENRERQGHRSPHFHQLRIDERHIPEEVYRSTHKPTREIDSPSGSPQERHVSIEGPCRRGGPQEENQVSVVDESDEHRVPEPDSPDGQERIRKEEDFHREGVEKRFDDRSNEYYAHRGPESEVAKEGILGKFLDEQCTDEERDPSGTDVIEIHELIQEGFADNGNHRHEAREKPHQNQ